MIDSVQVFDPGAPQQLSFNGYGPAAIPDPRDQVMDGFLSRVTCDGPAAAALVAGGASEDGRPLVLALVAAVLGGLDQNAPEAMMPMALIDDTAARLDHDPNG